MELRVNKFPLQLRCFLVAKVRTRAVRMPVMAEQRRGNVSYEVVRMRPIRRFLCFVYT